MLKYGKNLGIQEFQGAKLAVDAVQVVVGAAQALAHKVVVSGKHKRTESAKMLDIKEFWGFTKLLLQATAHT